MPTKPPFFPFRQQPTIAALPNILKISIEMNKQTGQTNIKVNQSIQALELISVLNQAITGNIQMMLKQQSMIIDPRGGADDRGTHASLGETTQEKESTDEGLSNVRNNSPQAS